MKAWRISLIVLALICLSALTAFSQQQQPGDEELKVRIFDALVMDHGLQGVMPEIVVTKGVVTLSGKLKSEYYRNRIIQVVRKTKGVGDIIDRMEVA